MGRIDISSVILADVEAAKQIVSKEWTEEEIQDLKAKDEKWANVSLRPDGTNPDPKEGSQPICYVSIMVLNRYYLSRLFSLTKLKILIGQFLQNGQLSCASVLSSLLMFCVNTKLNLICIRYYFIYISS